MATRDMNVMTLNQYQWEQHSFAQYGAAASEKVLKFAESYGAGSERLLNFVTFLYPSSKLAGEAGEVAEKLAKQVRDKAVFCFEDISEPDREAIIKELGDVLWYVSEIAFQLGCDLEEVARKNIEKLSSRQERGVLGGSGDDR